MMFNGISSLANVVAVASAEPMVSDESFASDVSMLPATPQAEKIQTVLIIKASDILLIILFFITNLKRLYSMSKASAKHKFYQIFLDSIRISYM